MMSTSNGKTRGLYHRWACLLWLLWAPAGLDAGAFGKVVAIGGHASDLALDESRGVLYVANFTANRIEVMSVADGSIQTSLNVASQPSSLALSPDKRFLLVAHYGAWASLGTPGNALTVIDLAGGSRQTLALSNPPLGVAFGIDGLALVVTTTEFVIFDPLLGTCNIIDTIAGVGANFLPQKPATFPPQIVDASVTASGDGRHIFGLTDTILFSYDVIARRVVAVGYVASPPFGPRTVSSARDGSYWLAGWGLFDNRGLLAQFPDPSGILNIGGHAIDSDRGLIYAQVTQASSTTSDSGSTTPAAAPPLLKIVAADNLAVLETLQLPENLAGKGVLSSDGATMYSVSDSGVLILPVGSLSGSHRVTARVEDLLFRGSFCNRSIATQDMVIEDPGGGRTAFSLQVTTAGISVSPSSGVTPAVVRVSVDPTVFQNQQGTTAALIQIHSSQAVNVPRDVRVLVNMQGPDQRGTLFNVPGQLVDILADPTRDRFFLLRQDTNQVLVFDAGTYSQTATLRTGNTPTQMAITFDRRYLLVGNDNSQVANVFDLETLEPQMPIRFPGGHYPRSLAASANAVLAATRVVGPKHKIDRVDVLTRRATELPTLGVYENDIDINTWLAASPNGATVIAAQASGNLLLYNANVDTFTISRKDSETLSGAVAASSYGQFVVGNGLLNASLVKTLDFDAGSGLTSGFAFVDQTGYRTTALTTSGPGVIERMDLGTGNGMKASRLAEAPYPGKAGAVFTRTIAPLYSRNAIVNLTVSGFTVLPWNYDVSVRMPHIDAVVNAADFTRPVAPGGLITVAGRDLSPVSLATRERPLPMALGESCLTVNGQSVPMIYVSPGQINAQLPWTAEGDVTMVLHTPGGVSDSFNFSVLPVAPAVFRSGVAGPETTLPTVFRSANNALVTPSNPVHRGDTLVIYLTGLGPTLPAVDAGNPAPDQPLAYALTEPAVELGGISLPILFAGLTPREVGLYQINATVPGWTPLGMALPLVIRQGGVATTINVRVVD